MQIDENRKYYDKIIAQFAETTITIDSINAYVMLRKNGCLEYVPRPEAINCILDLSTYREYWKEWAKDELPDDVFEEMAAKHKKEGIEKTEINDTDNFNIFKPKYDDEYGQGIYKIPVLEVAKDYFLLFEKNVNDYRYQNTKNDSTINLMKIYEMILAYTRSRLANSMDDMAYGNISIRDYDDYQNFRQAKAKIVKENYLAFKTIDEFENAEKNASDNISDSINFSDKTFCCDAIRKSFSKQIFIDLLKQKYPNNGFINKAISVYQRVTADESMMTQISNTFTLSKDEKFIDKNEQFINNMSFVSPNYEFEQ